MAGSLAEERIREKAVDALRRREPRARIIHELVLVQGGPRIDVAAVWPSGMIFVEIKSERDSLSRLQAQLRAATSIGAETWLCLAPKWRARIDLQKVARVNERKVPLVINGRTVGHSYLSDPAPTYLPELRQVEVRYETDDGFEPLERHASWLLRNRRYNPFVLLNMLWADELRRIAGVGSRACRDECIERAAEGLTGAQVREAVCGALRARAFPRADDPVEWVR